MSTLKNKKIKKMFFLLAISANIYYYKSVKIIIYISMDKNVFTREERAEISRDFRNEIMSHGLVNAVLTVLDSQSDKVAIKKLVLKQQCRKKDFAEKFKAACAAIKNTYPKRKMELRALQEEILPA